MTGTEVIQRKLNAVAGQLVDIFKQGLSGADRCRLRYLKINPGRVNMIFLHNTDKALGKMLIGTLNH